MTVPPRMRLSVTVTAAQAKSKRFLHNPILLPLRWLMLSTKPSAGLGANSMLTIMHTPVPVSRIASAKVKRRGQEGSGKDKVLLYHPTSQPERKLTGNCNTSKIPNRRPLMGSCAATQSR